MAKEDIKDLRFLHQEKNAGLYNINRARERGTEDKTFENLEAEGKKAVARASRKLVFLRPPNPVKFLAGSKAASDKHIYL